MRRQQLGDCSVAGVVGAFDHCSFDVLGEDDVEAGEFLLDGFCGDEEDGVGGAAGLLFDLIGVVSLEDHRLLVVAFIQAKKQKNPYQASLKSKTPHGYELYSQPPLLRPCRLFVTLSVTLCNRKLPGRDRPIIFGPDSQ